MSPDKPTQVSVARAGARRAAATDEPSTDADTPLDLRLAVGAVCAWLAVVWCVSRTAATALLLGSVAAVAAAALLMFARGRPRRWAAGLAVALFCVALVLLPLAGRLGHARASPLVVLAHEHAASTMRFTVRADPVVLAAAGPVGAARVAVAGDVESVTAAGRTISSDGSVLVLADATPWRDVLPGQAVELDGELSPDLDGGVLSVTMFARTPPRFLGTPPWWQRLAGSVRGGLRHAARVLPDQERGLLPGLIDGDTANLDPVLAERFRLAGLTHLVAVSGTNCSIVIGAVLLLLRRARARPWLCAMVGGVVLLMFVVVARPSPSVLRAALMATIALIALALGRPRAALPSLSAGTLVLLLWDPSLATSASFAMSVLATAALLVLAPGWARALRARHVPAGIAESVAVAAAAHLVTAPVVAAISGRVSIVAVAANVLAEPVVAVTTVLGFLAAVLAPWWFGAGTALAWTAGWPCRWLVRVADFFGGLHGATIPWPGGAAGGMVLLVVLALLGSATMFVGARRVLAAGAATATLILIPVRSVTSAWPPPGWVFVACDVGQGDALLLNAGPGSAVEIDAGPDPVSIDRCLHDFGVRHIPLLIFTHFHLDHVGGAPGVLRGRTVGRLLVGPLRDPQSGARIVQAVADRAGVTAQTPTVGTRLTVGAVILDVLGPESAFHGTRSDPNNSSLVLRATVGGIRIMLPGDAEVDAQRALLDAGLDLRADVLKVPHHGSAYSDPDFLAAVHARLAVVSVGLHNDYGHPSPVLLRELARLGVPLLRTDHDGDVAVTAVNGQVGAVRHGVAASTVGMAPERVDCDEMPDPCGAHPNPAPAATTATAAANPAVATSELRSWPMRLGAASGLGAWMASCPRDRSRWTICRPPSHPSCCWSATTNCSSIARSARSPPRVAATIPRSRRARCPARSSRDPSCMSC